MEREPVLLVGLASFVPESDFEDSICFDFVQEFELLFGVLEGVDKME